MKMQSKGVAPISSHKQRCFERPCEIEIVMMMMMIAFWLLHGTTVHHPCSKPLTAGLNSKEAKVIKKIVTPINDTWERF